MLDLCLQDLRHSIAILFSSCCFRLFDQIIFFLLVISCVLVDQMSSSSVFSGNTIMVLSFLACKIFGTPVCLRWLIILTNLVTYVSRSNKAFFSLKLEVFVVLHVHLGWSSISLRSLTLAFPLPFHLDPVASGLTRRQCLIET